MDLEIIELIASKIGKLKEFEPLHVKPENIKEASEFRELIKRNKYLAPKDLQILISKYLAALDEYEKDLSSARYDLKRNLPAEMMLPTSRTSLFRDSIFHILGQTTL